MTVWEFRERGGRGKRSRVLMIISLVLDDSWKSDGISGYHGSMLSGRPATKNTILFLGLSFGLKGLCFVMRRWYFTVNPSKLMDSHPATLTRWRLIINWGSGAGSKLKKTNHQYVAP